MEIRVHVGGDTIVIVYAYDISVILLYQPVFHAFIIGLPQLAYDLFAFVVDFLQRFFLHVCFDHITWLPV